MRLLFKSVIRYFNELSFPMKAILCVLLINMPISYYCFFTIVVPQMYDGQEASFQLQHYLNLYFRLVNFGICLYIAHAIIVVKEDWHER